MAGFDMASVTLAPTAGGWTRSESGGRLGLAWGSPHQGLVEVLIQHRARQEGPLGEEQPHHSVVAAGLDPLHPGRQGDVLVLLVIADVEKYLFVGQHFQRAAPDHAGPRAADVTHRDVNRASGK